MKRWITTDAVTWKLDVNTGRERLLDGIPSIWDVAEGIPCHSKELADAEENR